MIETYLQPLPHGITLSCRAAGQRGRPVLIFLHGFPEAAFVWDTLLAHFSQAEHGGYRCIAPNLRGFEKSSSPTDVSAYRPKHLVQDIAALIAIEAENQGGQLACLVAHDWGGAVAWNLANQRPQLIKRLAIINSPHPGTFLRELKHSPQQQAASAYMNFLIRPDAEQQLSASDFKRLWPFFSNMGNSSWLTEEVKDQYREVWRAGLTGGCNYYRASPLRPPRADDPAAANVELPREMLTVDVPTLVIWALDDIALPPALVDGLDAYVSQLTLKTVPNASHWIVHEQPVLVMQYLEDFLLSNK
ncbi:MAG: alpha/beta hydrolase [Gammaproteobacteria bacterium]|nr:alpha/beta hydrolase [Gammaproteobacteria bacterium]MBU0786915.1 alpha/beta hydrolase [Gammaproteobacteria bacterium]MBU0813879.1 alpha/beta hydrolase [Gammaproteobacteria bacterium]MBU1788648.1 alpha/beta hydrolase [Gammaproteobacteria bacterium]